MLLFFAVGGLLFLIAPRADHGDEIHLSRTSLRSVAEAEARRRHVRELPAAVADALRQQVVDDELLYREGLRLGVDKNDNIVRQRVIEKMMFLAEDLGGSSRPVSDAELARYLETHRERFRRPTVIRLVHVFAATDPALLVRLSAGLAPGIEGAAGQPPPVGDAFPLGRRAVEAPLEAIAKSYGPGFAASVAALPIGEWSAPVRSLYGFHLVKVIARTDGGVPALAAARNEVRLAYVQERSTRARAELIRAIRARYHVSIDDSAEAVPAGGAFARTAVAAPEAD